MNNLNLTWPHEETRVYWEKKFKEMKRAKKERAKFFILPRSKEWLGLTDNQYEKFQQEQTQVLLNYSTGQRSSSKDKPQPLTTEELDNLLPVEEFDVNDE